MIQIKRAYDKASGKDGTRILVDRLWPRGISKAKAKLSLWLKEVAPSDRLRKWFSHDPKKWQEFKKRYFKELKNKKDTIQTILSKAKGKTVTLVYAAKDEEHNNAVALMQYLKKHKKN